MAHIRKAFGHFKSYYTTPRKHETRLKQIDLTSTLERGNLKSKYGVSNSSVTCNVQRTTDRKADGYSCGSDIASVQKTTDPCPAEINTTDSFIY